MDINVKLNDYKYRYDVYHIFNIYFFLKKINFSKDEGDYSIYVTDDYVEYTHENQYEKECFNGKEKPKDRKSTRLNSSH